MKKILILTTIAASTMMVSCNNGAPKANLKTEIDTLSYEIGMASSPGQQLGGYLTSIGSDSAYQEEFLRGFRDGLIAGDDKKKMAYFQGVQAGMQTKMQTFAGVEHQIFGNDSTKHLSVKNYLAGFTALVHNKTALKIDGKLIDQQEAGQLATEKLQSMAKRMLEEQYGDLKKKSEDFMAGIAKTEGIKSAGDGVYYKVIKEGSGEMPTPTSTIEVKYEGKLIDGTVFDSTEQHQQGETSQLPMQSIIRGWSTALVKMPVGSVWEIYIPYNMGYGEQGVGAIPPFSALIFHVELVGIK